MEPSSPKGLDRQRCQVGGVNENYKSSAGTLYHIQVEDLGPIVDRLTGLEVRRVNVIVYANYREANARIIHGHDHDFPDQRTHEHNQAIQEGIRGLVVAARAIIEEKESSQITRIKGLIRQYHHTKTGQAKRAFEEANGLFPFLFARAWSELKREKAAGPTASSGHDDVVYPLDAALRERVIDIERLMRAITEDLERLQAAGNADDILIQTCRKLTRRAREALVGRQGSPLNARRLDMTRNSLTTTWRQIKGRFRPE